MTGFIDIHNHIAFGMDDGATDIDMATKMLLAASHDGVTDIIATPHATPGWQPFDNEALTACVDSLNDVSKRLGLALTVYTGCEIFYSEEALRFLDNGFIPTLASSPYVLMEFRPDMLFESIYDALRRMRNAGYIPVIAHIERYRNLHSIDDMRLLKAELDVRIQVNCSSLIGKIGFFEKRFIGKMIKSGLVDYLATDSHNITTRATCMDEAYRIAQKKIGRECADQLLMTNPLEIIQKSI